MDMEEGWTEVVHLGYYESVEAVLVAYWKIVSFLGLSALPSNKWTP